MSIRSFFIFSSIIIFVSGCAFAPGQKMDAERISNDSSSESNQVELIPITPKLIAVDDNSIKNNDIPTALLDYKPDSYRIGPSDVLFITVWDHPEMTVPSGAPIQGSANGRIVRPDGTLFYPYIGNIKAEGKTIEELRDTIAISLAKYIDNPQVDINMQEFVSQQVLLSGAFTNTHPIPITTKPLTLVEALGIAGVNNVAGNLSNLILQRDGVDYKLNILALNREPSDISKIYLKNGDRIHMPYNDSSKVYVMGEVNYPKALRFETDTMTLTEAIGSVGGLNQITAKGNDVYVIRGIENLEKEKAKIFQLSAKSPSAFILATNFHLKPQDVVYVGASGVTRWNRFISQILPSLNLVSISAKATENVQNLEN